MEGKIQATAERRDGLRALTDRRVPTSAWALCSLLIALVGCTNSNSSPPVHCGAPALEQPLLVLEGDEMAASALGRIGTDGCFLELAEEKLGFDAALSAAHGKPFVCNRARGICYSINKDTLQIPALGIVTNQGDEDSNPNPHDLDVDASGQFWIARYNLSSVAVVGSDLKFAAAVDLGSLADADGVPDMESLRIVGDRAYAALELLGPDNLPTGPGTIAVLDVNARTLVDSFSLIGKNPFGPMKSVPSDPSGATVAIATPGDFYNATEAECGVELVDLANKTSTLLLSEADVGGSVIEAVIAGPTEGYAIVATPDTDNATWVVAFNPANPAMQKVTRTLADTRSRPAGERGFFFWGLAIDGDLVAVGDRTADSPGVHFYRRSDGHEVVPELPVQIFPPIGVAPL